MAIYRKCSKHDCQIDRQCNRPKSCIDGQCQIVIRECQPQCRDGEICRAGICLKIEVEYCEHPFKWDASRKICTNKCSSTHECAPLACIQGRCQKPYCYNSLDCVLGQFCSGGLCQYTCKINADCPNNMICSNNFECKKSCRSCTDCETSQYCNGLTHLTMCESTICLLNSDCKGRGEVCHFGKCVRRIFCSTEYDCPTGYTCNGKDGQKVCIPFKVCMQGIDSCSDTCFDGQLPLCMKEIHCKENSQCPENMFCNSFVRKCFPQNCRYSKCAEGFYCFRDRCIPTAIIIKDCSKEKCNAGQLCIGKQCIYPDCYTSEDCPKNKFCLEGKCQTEWLDSCKNCEYTCHEGQCKQVECIVDSNCIYPEICNHNQICVRPQCSQNDDCPSGSLCTNKRCILSSKVCKWNDDSCKCKTNKECINPGMCENEKCIWPCRLSRDCGYGYICDYGKCHERDCYLDDDCVDGKFCSSGECIYVERCSISKRDYNCIQGVLLKDPVCKSQRCKEGYVCVLDVCVQVGISCSHNGHCSEFTTCVADRCEFNMCKRDADCSDSRVCKHGICLPRITHCRFDSDCDGGSNQKCVERRCKSACSDYSCPYGYKCRGGECIIKVERCDLFNPCPRGSVCITTDKDASYGKCIKEVCTPLKGCKDNEMCITGQCVGECNACNHESFSCSREANICLPTIIERCRRDNCPWPFKCVRGKCSNICSSNSDCYYENGNFEFECKDKKCTRKHCGSDGICKQPSSICNKHQMCEKLECLVSSECRDHQTCYLGYCIDVIKQRRCDEGYSMIEKLLFCIPDYIKTTISKQRIKIYCLKDRHCPEEMKCGRDNLCKIRECDYPIDGKDEPSTDSCGPGRLCMSIEGVNVCAPAYECQHQTCTHPATPQGNMFTCLYDKCYVSVHECESHQDCADEESCEFNSNNIRKCIDLTCHSTKKCSKNRICMNGYCEECRDCQTNYDCKYGQTCAQSRCCVPRVHCSSYKDCDGFLVEGNNREICHNRFCTVCYEDTGKN